MQTITLINQKGRVGKTTCKRLTNNLKKEAKKWLKKEKKLK